VTDVSFAVLESFGPLTDFVIDVMARMCLYDDQADQSSGNETEDLHIGNNERTLDCLRIRYLDTILET
jgi:hypothetical protein